MSVLTNLAAQTQLPVTVLVVDNGGTLREQDLLEMPLSDRTELVSRADNPGYAAAVNLASSRLGVRTSALLVLTHDSDFDEHLAAGLLRALDAEPRAGAAAPILRWSSRPERVFSAGGVLHRGGRASHLTSPRQGSPYEVDWVDGAVVMYRKRSLDAIGWLDERYFLYFEDVDTAWAMRQCGHRTLIAPEVVARQEPGAHPLYLGSRNMILFARKTTEAPVLQAIAVARRAIEDSLSRIMHGRAPRINEAWRGWRDGRNGISGKPPEAQ